jgi:hypothetical protein
MIQTEQYQPIYEALAAIAGVDEDRARVVNGIGFSRFDGPVAHALVDLGVERWTDRDAMRGYRIAKRYAATQLPVLGIDPATLVEPVVERDDQPVWLAESDWKVQKYGPGFATAAIEEGSIVLAWGGADPLFRERVASVKAAFTGARWNPDGKHWRVPVTVPNLLALAGLLGEYTDTALPFDEDPALRDRADTMLREKEARIIASAAKEAAPQALVRTIEPERVRPYQHAGIAYMRANRKVINADDMGLGKTCQAVVTVIEEGALPCLVICPASLKLNWKREIALWGGDGLTVTVVSGRTAPVAITKQVGKTDFTVVNYDILHAWEGKLGMIPWKAIVADEFHYIKSGTRTQRGAALKAIVAKAKPDYVLGLTGTPVLNRPVELWPLLDVIGGQDEFGGFFPYAKKFCDAQQGTFGWDFSGASNLDELNATLRGAGKLVRRLKDDVLDELPPKQWATVSLAMTPRERKTYEWAERDIVGYIAQTTGEVIPEDGKALVQLGTLRRLAWEAKRKAAFEWIDDFLQSGKKLVIFGWHRETIEAVRERYGCPTIMGGQSGVSVEAG